MLIESITDDIPDEQKILAVFTSFISDAINVRLLALRVKKSAIINAFLKKLKFESVIEAGGFH